MDSRSLIKKVGCKLIRVFLFNRCNRINKVFSFMLLQRLKPSDPVLSFRQCERHTFSMRPGRETKYNIRIQYFNERHHYKVADTGPITQRFSLADKTNMSEVCRRLLLVEVAIHLQSYYFINAFQKHFRQYFSNHPFVK